MNRDSPTVVHAYGLVEADERLELPEHGIAHTGVRVIPFHGLGVVVGELPAQAFGEAAWADHGQDPEWVTPVATTHHAVLQHLVEQADVLPLRLPGIYPDDDALLVALESSREHLDRTWRFLAGHVEWSLHVFATSPPPAEESPAPRSGREYLERRRSQADARDEGRQRRQALLVDAYEALAREATASVMRRPLDSAVTGRDESMLLNSAHLVLRGEEQQFLGIAEEVHHELVAAAGMRVEVTGPWPPYSFVDAVEERGDHLTGSAP